MGTRVQVCAVVNTGEVGLVRSGLVRWGLVWSPVQLFGGWSEKPKSEEKLGRRPHNFWLSFHCAAVAAASSNRKGI